MFTFQREDRQLEQILMGLKELRLLAAVEDK